MKFGPGLKYSGKTMKTFRIKTDEGLVVVQAQSLKLAKEACGLKSKNSKKG